MLLCPSTPRQGISKTRPLLFLLPLSLLSIFLLLFPQVSATTAHNITGTLLLAIEICRHGDRTPLDHYSFDALPLSAWKVGVGQLTPLGVRAHYNLGTHLRYRYITHHKLLSGNWNASEVYVRASGIDRTIMSASSQMSGMFPPGSSRDFDIRTEFGGDRVSGEEVWMEDGGVPPIVHSENKETDQLLLAGRNCDAFRRWLDRRKYTKEWKKLEGSTRDIRADLGELMKKKGGKEVGLKEVARINDVWRCYEAHGAPLPLGITRNKRRRVNEIGDKLLVMSNKGRQTHRWRSGLLLYEIRERLRQMKMITDGELEEGQIENGLKVEAPKFVLYSAHDSTLAALLSALGTFDGKNPAYNSTVFVELLQMEDDSFTVRVEYNNEIMHLPGCNDADQCDYDTYMKVTKDVTFDSPAQGIRECAVGMRKTLYKFGMLDADRDAGVKRTDTQNDREVDIFGFHIGAVGALLAMGLVALTIIACFCFGRRDKDGAGRYGRLDTFDESQNLYSRDERERQTILM